MGYFLLVVTTLILLATDAFGNIHCQVFLGEVGKDLTINQRGELVFKTAVNVLQNGTGAKLPNDGRQAAIPAEFFDPLIEAFQKDYTSSATPEGRQGRAAAPQPIAAGNVGHMKDHLDYYDKFSPEFHEKLGVDPKSLKLAVVAHDIGKGFLDEFLDAYVANRTNKDFVKQYVLAHEFHSLARIPSVVKSVLEAKGIDPNSARGRKLLYGISTQIMEMIRYHNGVQVVQRMQERYPGMDPKEVQGLLEAWWPHNYRRFAADFKDLGVNPEYGTDTRLGAIPAVLNLADRSTLVTPAAPAKLAKQRLPQLGFTTDMITESTVVPARDNIPQIVAQASQLRPYLKDPTTDVQQLAAVRAGKEASDRMIAFGRKLLAMNQPAELAPLKLKPEEVPVDLEAEREKLRAQNPQLRLAENKLQLEKLAYEAIKGRKQYLYFRTAKNEWYRVEGSNPAAPVSQKLGPDGWSDVRTGGHPVDHLMSLASDDGIWPKI